MRYRTICAASVCLVAMSLAAGADPVSRNRMQEGAPIQFTQMTDSGVKTDAVPRRKAKETKKQNTLTQRVKRAWRELTGYRFTVACPAFPIPLIQNRSTCTETGKNRDDARAKCQSQRAFCSVADAS